MAPYPPIPNVMITFCPSMSCLRRVIIFFRVVEKGDAFFVLVFLLFVECVGMVGEFDVWELTWDDMYFLIWDWVWVANWLRVNANIANTKQQKEMQAWATEQQQMVHATAESTVVGSLLGELITELILSDGRARMRTRCPLFFPPRFGIFPLVFCGRHKHDAWRDTGHQKKSSHISKYVRSKYFWKIRIEKTLHLEIIMIFLFI